MLSKNIHIRPVIPSACRSHDLNRLREERNQLSIPSSHLTTCIPERTKDSIEVTPATLFQSTDEFIALALGGGGLDEFEFRREALVDVVVVFDVVADMKDAEFGHFQIFFGLSLDLKNSVILCRWRGMARYTRCMHRQLPSKADYRYKSDRRAWGTPGT